MMQQQHQQHAIAKPRLRALILCMIVTGVLSPFALLGGWLVRRYCAASSWDYRERWAGAWAFAALGALIYSALAVFAHALGFLWVGFLITLAHHMTSAALWLLILWGYNSLLAPVCALLYEGIAPRTRKLLTGQAQIGTFGPPITASAATSPAMASALVPASARLPVEVNGMGVIGHSLGGELWQWQVGGAITYPPEKLGEHALAVGMSGTGKSDLLTRLAYIGRHCYDMKVVRIDCKGDWLDAAKFKVALLAAGASSVGIYPVDRHNGWYGTRQDVLNRLLSCQRFEHSYYEGVCYNMLKMALYAPGAPPVASGQELVARLWPDRLKQLYKGRPEWGYLQGLPSDAIWGPYGRYNALFSVVGDRLDGKRGFGDHDCSYYLLDQKRLGKQLAIFGKLLLDDFELFCALRQHAAPRKPRILLLIDDYSAFSEHVRIFDLMERLRSAGVVTIAAAQGYQSLGLDQNTIRRLLEAGGTMILFRSALPKELLEVFATHEVPEISYRFDQQRKKDPWGFTEIDHAALQMRMVEKSVIHPNDVKRLGRGEIYLNNAGRHHHIQVEPLPLNPDMVEDQRRMLLVAYDQALKSWEASQTGGPVLPAPPPQPKRPRGKPAAQPQKQPHHAVPNPQPGASAAPSQPSNASRAAGPAPTASPSPKPTHPIAPQPSQSASAPNPTQPVTPPPAGPQPQKKTTPGQGLSLSDLI